MAELLKGAAVAAALEEQLRGRAAALEAEGINPCLAILRLGEREDDIAYEKAAMKRCQAAGVGVHRFLLRPDANQGEVLAAVREINQDSGLHGCLIFRPLPSHLDSSQILNSLDPAKDVDGVTHSSLAGVFANIRQGFPPCTAQACLDILDHYGIALKGKRATVIGRSLVVGKPVSLLLQARHATVTMCHTRTVDLPARCREAEILLAAAGQAQMVDAGFVSPGQVVIDVGINFNAEGRLVGDVRFDEVEPIVSAITPVPGGVGTVTAAVLAKHVIIAAEQQRG